MIQIGFVLPKPLLHFFDKYCITIRRDRNKMIRKAFSEYVKHHSLTFFQIAQEIQGIQQISTLLTENQSKLLNYLTKKIKMNRAEILRDAMLEFILSHIPEIKLKISKSNLYQINHILKDL